MSLIAGAVTGQARPGAIGAVDVVANVVDVVDVNVRMVIEKRAVPPMTSPKMLVSRVSAVRDGDLTYDHRIAEAILKVPEFAGTVMTECTPVTDPRSPIHQVTGTSRIKIPSCTVWPSD